MDHAVGGRVRPVGCRGRCGRGVRRRRRANCFRRLGRQGTPSLPRGAGAHHLMAAAALSLCDGLPVARFRRSTCDIVARPAPPPRAVGRLIAGLPALDPRLGRLAFAWLCRRVDGCCWPGRRGRVGRLCRSGRGWGCCGVGTSRRWRGRAGDRRRGRGWCCCRRTRAGGGRRRRRGALVRSWLGCRRLRRCCARGRRGRARWRSGGRGRWRTSARRRTSRWSGPCRVGRVHHGFPRGEGLACGGGADAGAVPGCGQERGGTDGCHHDQHRREGSPGESVGAWCWPLHVSRRTHGHLVLVPARSPAKPRSRRNALCPSDRTPCHGLRRSPRSSAAAPGVLVADAIRPLWMEPFVNLAPPTRVRCSGTAVGPPPSLPRWRYGDHRARQGHRIRRSMAVERSRGRPRCRSLMSNGSS